MENLGALIDGCLSKIKRMEKSRAYVGHDEAFIEYLKTFYSLCYDQIHGYLSGEGTDEAEKEIRRVLRDLAIFILPLIEKLAARKLKSYRDNIKKHLISESNVEKKLLLAYQELYDDFYALVAFRSIEHFALYMEWDLPEREKIWKYNLNCFHGYWYYANRLVLDGDITFLEKQCPTGYGKSYSDTVLIAFIFGYDYNADIMKVTGSPANVNDGMVKLTSYMCSKRYAKVFPYYAQFNRQESEMFVICQKGGNNQAGKLLIKGSRKGTSFAYYSKNMHIDGTRFKYRFYDDITVASDKDNIFAHDKDYAAYKNTWERRKYDDFCSFEFASGTTYHEQCFLSRIKREHGGDDAARSSVNKFTYINQNKKSVFVVVPKLDPQSGESTYPHKYKTEEAVKARENDYETFMAMDMQEPLPPEGTPFARQHLQEYEFIPHEDDSSYCWATLDPNRTGANYVAMAICEPIGDKHYLKDCVFELEPIEKLYNIIIDKIIRHKITKLQIERNTDTSLASLFRKMLAERGINYCEISEFYTSKNKEAKISSMSEVIKKNMIFPKLHLYGASSPMGKFMKYFTTYTFLRKNLFDDSADVISMYAEKFIMKNSLPKVKVLNRRH